MKSASELAVFVVATLLLTLGCVADRTETHTYGHVGWNATGDASVRGIDQAMIRWYTRDGKLVYVVWTDLPGGGGTSGGSSGHSTQEREQHETTVDLSDSSQFQFSYVRDLTDKGAAGQLSIGDLTFDTGLGRLLLVSTQADRTKVKQLEIPSALVSILLTQGHTRESLQRELQQLVRQENELKNYFAAPGTATDESAAISGRALADSSTSETAS